jgi:hypothetical protein
MLRQVGVLAPESELFSSVYLQGQSSARKKKPIDQCRR